MTETFKSKRYLPWEQNIKRQDKRREIMANLKNKGKQGLTFF